ncbi:hypothetical protein CLTEP_26930 [Clostridium tepidiprofundi DSM 19306]|uniref:Uncharacterized protein n=1 Tax=Clostridium tepidiprofundi DSM 19306 TaxID=1121338 RepID=A0A151AR27_9CLOT|nr:hypothetical protein [Clostridium tepidiprofundi]KYH30052.1 hypothetical protein CLTEP_26930 [Clostridium tepidiprofundi DSM 19306]
MKIQSVSAAKDNKNVSTSIKSIEGKNSTNKMQDKKEISNSESKIFINEKSVKDKKSTFPFGMSKDELMIKLKKLKLKVKGEIEITSSKEDPELGNPIIMTDDISFSFDRNNQLLYAIGIKQNIPTSLGLKNGDSLEKIVKLYGTNYKKYNPGNGFVYEYCFNNHYFRVFIEQDKVTGWAVSKYKFLK